jgi:hypothetical protein
MVSLSGGIYSTVKYHSIVSYALTSTAKTMRDRIWQAVLVGRYPPKK